MYNDMNFKIPKESDDYIIDSNNVKKQIELIIKTQIEQEKNEIIINTNLKYGLPMENINKLAGPIIEAWIYEVFESIKDQEGNSYNLINVESCTRLNIADVVLQFKKEKDVITTHLDSKATAEDIENSGKGPNITSFSRIRSAYIEDPDFMFFILSINHKVYSEKNKNTNLIDSIMKIVGYNAFDLKFVSESDISYNPSLGTGQIQIKDIHYVEYQERTTWEFCQILDKKYLNSSKKTFEDWYNEARKNKWIKSD